MKRLKQRFSVAWTFLSERLSLQRFHRNNSGSISIVSVFAVIFLAMLLGMLMNIGRRVDRKIQMQNGADAATYSGGVVLARGMNTLAFTNHLLCDVFAMTAYLREARDRNAEPLSQLVLDAWQEVAPKFADAPLPKFSNLAEGIPPKIPLEQELVSLFSQQNAAVSEQLLPVMEEILALELIPEFQRALVESTPRLAQSAANEIANGHGSARSGLSAGSPLACVLWRTDGLPFDSPAEADRSTLPAADPVYDMTEFQPRYLRDGIAQRRRYANEYLRQLNNTMLRDFDRVGNMSQFANLWRGFTCGYLRELLDEYPSSNIPYQLRRSTLQQFDRNAYIDLETSFVGVVYWEKMPERLPGLFDSSLDADDSAFTQIRLFLPRPRLIYDPTREPEYQYYRQGVPRHRDLMNQNWSTQIVPATSASIPTILQTQPPNLNVRVPSLGGIDVQDFRRINTH